MMIYERKLIQKDIKGSYQADRLQVRTQQKTTSNAGGSELYIQLKTRINFLRPRPHLPLHHQTYHQILRCPLIRRKHRIPLQIHHQLQC